MTPSTKTEKSAGAGADVALERAVGWIGRLADDVGARRPTSESERRGAEMVAAELRTSGVDARIEPFRGYSSFAAPYAVILSAAVAAGLLPRRMRRLRSALSLGAVAGLVTEGGLVYTPLSQALSRRRGQNVVATIEPRGEIQRAVCLVGHLDSSRSGLMFDRRFVRHLRSWLAAQTVAVLVQGLEPLVRRLRWLRRPVRMSRVLAAVGLALLVEREVRGEDVPGANDNASGTAVAMQLACECAGASPESTSVVLLLTGCEESGLLGSQAFLRSRDTSGWLFVNFDGVGAPATLRFLRKEGVVTSWKADGGLVRIAEAIAGARPELGLEGTDSNAGLTYDTTPVLARGGRAITFSAQDETIPNYHQLTDTADRIEPARVAAALEVGREMIAAIDRGEAD